MSLCLQNIYKNKPADYGECYVLSTTVARLIIGCDNSLLVSECTHSDWNKSKAENGALIYL